LQPDRRKAFRLDVAEIPPAALDAKDRNIVAGVVHD
jgi:hypothetical protein